MTRLKVSALLLFLVVTFFCVRAQAYPPFLKQAQQLGFQAKNCTFCHEKNDGGKGWNDRGLWLKAKKKELKAPVVEVKWLKAYKDPKEGTDKPKDGDIAGNSDAEKKEEQKPEEKQPEDQQSAEKNR